MKNNKLKNGFFLILITSFFTIACTKSFLDIEPKGVQLAADFYKTDEQAFQGLVAAYDMLQTMNNDIFFKTPWTLRVFPSDEVICGGGGRGDQPPLEETNEFNYGPAGRHVQDVYDRSYKGINRCNIVMTYVADDSPNKKIYRAEAKFLRALFYSDLVTFFGEVPLVLTELNPSEYQQPPSTTVALWSQIEKDLTEAITDLPIKSEYSYNDKFRASKGAAQALLGKAFLYQQKYDQAAAQFQAVIVSGEYGLIADYSQVLRKDEEFGLESIIEIPYTDEYKYDWSNYNWDDSKYSENNLLFQWCGPRAEFFYNLDSIGMYGGWGGGYPTAAMYNAYVAEGDNVRRAASLITESEFLAKGVTRSSSPIYGYNGFLRVKYGTLIEEANNKPYEINYGSNMRLMRYADLLLMAAEALTLKPSPDFATALTYVNQVRSRVGLPDATESGTELMKRIITERRLELSFEGHRFPDLIRWNKAGLISDGELSTILDATRPEIPNRKPFEAKFKLFPIPEQELMVNPKMKQNTGY